MLGSFELSWLYQIVCLDMSALLLMKALVEENRTLAAQVAALQKQLDGQHQDAEGLQHLRDGAICKCHPISCNFMPVSCHWGPCS